MVHAVYVCAYVRPPYSSRYTHKTRVTMRIFMFTILLRGMQEVTSLNSLFKNSDPAHKKCSSGSGSLKSGAQPHVKWPNLDQATARVG